ncbi:TVP38/TMEM64 family inner membrane protein YdjZ [Corynebacterium occultum]|uniref:TVP38/TMEM64 family membrane protein n=1 Tax=Corynebacterium occultum TaxID=2675219 RepID=A0A6B8W484_9CORY|nr:TVP38/TMEM64 family protein [Corynebacterium occultum]QGU08354.1 TVP38/TMEM64 family inner membrane protein YdjZ [Corynebacterium occultum]
MSESEKVSEPEKSPNPEANLPGIQWGPLLRGAGLLVFVVVMLWLAFNVRLPDLEVIQAWLEGLGWAGFLGFILLYALVALTPIPVTIMALAGGLLYGVVVGSVLSVVGALLGCWGAYWIARGLGKETVKKLLGDYGAKVEGHLEGAGFQAVFMLRVMPGLPYWPVNYGAGVFGINHRDYLVASSIAIVPGQVSLIAIGNFISEPNLSNGVIVGVAWAVVLAMTGWGYFTWRDARREAEAGAGPGPAGRR